MLERNDIPGLENYNGNKFVVAYLDKKELDEFFDDWKIVDSNYESILTHIALKNCGFHNGKINLDYKGCVLGYRKDYTKETEIYFENNDFSRDDLEGFDLYNPFFTIEPEDLTKENKVYYKVVIYSVIKDYLEDFIIYWFENGSLKKWEDKFFYVNIKT